MRKFIKIIIFIVVSFALFLLGCTADVNKKEEQSNEEENTSISSGDIENNNTSIDSMKQIYLEKLNKLEKDLDKSLREKYASPKTQDMIDAANKEYSEWDNMLNEICTKLEEELPKDEMYKLRDEELAWIEARDKKAQESHDEFKGGTLAPLSTIKSISKSTKSRCYELVNQYMK